MKTLSVAEVGSLACVNTGLTCDRRTVQPTTCVTHHAHIEVNLIKNGSVAYLYGGNEIPVGAGRLATFWSAIPHQIVGVSHDAEYYAMTIPLTRFLQYRLPEEFAHLVLDGQVLVDPQASPKGDFDMFERWIEDLRLRQPARDRIVLLEVEARLLRFADGLAAQSSSRKNRLKALPVCDSNSADRIRQMLSFIAQNYTDQITVELIGKSAGLHPNYAMNLFRKAVGTTLVHYITRLRVSRARQLLATSDDKVVDVALSSGFNSLSRFNDVFKRTCGSSPREYRERCRKYGLN
jgi:AraC family transcriptional regulator, melibiose operon regulatory protein